MSYSTKTDDEGTAVGRDCFEHANQWHYMTACKAILQAFETENNEARRGAVGVHSTVCVPSEGGAGE